MKRRGAWAANGAAVRKGREAAPVAPAPAPVPMPVLPGIVARLALK